MINQHKKLIVILTICASLSQSFSSLSPFFGSNWIYSEYLTIIFAILSIILTFILGYKFIADDFKNNIKNDEKLINKRNYRMFTRKLHLNSTEQCKIWNLEEYR